MITVVWAHSFMNFQKAIIQSNDSTAKYVHWLNFFYQSRCRKFVIHVVFLTAEGLESFRRSLLMTFLMPYCNEKVPVYWYGGPVHFFIFPMSEWLRKRTRSDGYERFTVLTWLAHWTTTRGWLQIWMDGVLSWETSWSVLVKNTAWRGDNTSMGCYKCSSMCFVLFTISWHGFRYISDGTRSFKYIDVVLEKNTERWEADEQQEWRLLSQDWLYLWGT